MKFDLDAFEDDLRCVTTTFSPFDSSKSKSISFSLSSSISSNIIRSRCCFFDFFADASDSAFSITYLLTSFLNFRIENGPLAAERIIVLVRKSISLLGKRLVVFFLDLPDLISVSGARNRAKLLLFKVRNRKLKFVHLIEAAFVSLPEVAHSDIELTELY